MRAGCASRRRNARTRRGLNLTCGGFVLSVLLVAGCGPNAASGTAPARRAPATHLANPATITNTDPCANRLHDLCGPLLLYFNAQRRLPDKLEDLSQVPGFENIRDFTCPVSGKPYVYDPKGLAGLEPGSRVIIYDPLPSHSGMRWGVAVTIPGNDDPLIAKVIGLPESKFAHAAGR